MRKSSIILSIFIGLVVGLSFCKKTDEKIRINPIVKPGFTVMDYDSNEYKTIQIGQQIWLQENLRTFHYNDGRLISTMWIYDSDTAAVEDYGFLYSWSTLEDSCGVCPEGMHVPSQHEVKVLVEYLGGVKLAGGYLKDTDPKYWETPNNGANNESQWSGRASGYFSPVSSLFINRRKIGYWWTQSNHVQGKGMAFTLDKVSMDVDFINFPFDFGFSIRCLHDSLDLSVSM